MASSRQIEVEWYSSVTFDNPDSKIGLWNAKFTLRYPDMNIENSAFGSWSEDNLDNFRYQIFRRFMDYLEKVIIFYGIEPREFIVMKKCLGFKINEKIDSSAEIVFM